MLDPANNGPGERYKRDGLQMGQILANSDMRLPAS